MPYVCGAKLHNLEWSYIAIRKMFTDQSFTENKAVMKRETVQKYCLVSWPRFNTNQIIHQ